MPQILLSPSVTEDYWSTQVTLLSTTLVILPTLPVVINGLDKNEGYRFTIFEQKVHIVSLLILYVTAMLLSPSPPTSTTHDVKQELSLVSTFSESLTSPLLPLWHTVVTVPIHLILNEFKKSGIDLAGDRMAIQRIREAAEKAKTELSSTTQTEINLPFITADASGPKHISTKLLRSQFDSLVDPLVKRTVDPARRRFQMLVSRPTRVTTLFLSVTCMIYVGKTVQSIFGREPSKGVNSDEAVAKGAAIQGGVLAGNVTDILLLDITPLSLGIETLGGIMTKLINRNTTIPTAADGQTAIEVKIYQGEHGIVNVFAKDNVTNKDQSLTIASSSGLSDKDIEKMADSVCTDTEKAMNQFKDQLDATEKEKVTKLIAELWELAVKGQAADPSRNETQQASLGLFQKVYEKRNAKNNSQEKLSEPEPEKD
ncbi:HSP70-domain-containing protein [Dendrothele bispora CBS 962.96]|uniref:HSP70-domain-containing protein n=1 Tax=Dendrothele bispora (strain CBS 962.96) TaxID=1314807 RepID=A0A4S8LDF4_DENBC|nr:HSP70-domain-containing protein [Dendrothele bispora CBS 962.96]